MVGLDLGGRQWGLQTTGLVRGPWVHAPELEIGQRLEGPAAPVIVIDENLENLSCFFLKEIVSIIASASGRLGGSSRRSTPFHVHELSIVCVDCRWASHGSADGHLGCLHVLAAMDVYVHTLLVDVGFHLFLVFLLVSLGALGVPPAMSCGSGQCHADTSAPGSWVRSSGVCLGPDGGVRWRAR